jgi:hypothetical protein
MGDAHEALRKVVDEMWGHKPRQSERQVPAETRLRRRKRPLPTETWLGRKDSVSIGIQIMVILSLLLACLHIPKSDEDKEYKISD